MDLNGTVDQWTSFTVPLLISVTPIPTKHRCATEVISVFHIRQIVVPILSLVIAVVNFIVVISSGLILKNGLEPRATYLFLGNIAMADFLMGIGDIFKAVFPENSRTHRICIIIIGSVVSAIMASVFSVGLVAIDRYIYIVHGLSYHKWLSSKRARLLIILVWILSCIIAFAPITGWAKDTMNGKCCWFTEIAHSELLITIVFLSLIPLGIVLVLYSIILYYALKKIKLLATNNNEINSQKCKENTNRLRMFKGSIVASRSSGGITKTFSKKPNKWRAVKVVLLTAGCYVATVGSFLLANFLFAVHCHGNFEKCPTSGIMVRFPFMHLNGMLNPIIYAWWHTGFRVFVKKRIRKFLLKYRDGPGITILPLNGRLNSNSNSEVTNIGCCNQGFLPDVRQNVEQPEGMSHNI